MKDQKNEFGLWIIILAVIALFILFMPNIERLIFGRTKKEKVTEEETEKETDNKEEVVNSGKITCGGTLTDNSSIEYVIYYEDDKTSKYVVTQTTTFTEKNTDYTNTLDECNNLLTYSSNDGYEATCSSTDLLVVQKETFDLKDYKDFDYKTKAGVSATKKSTIEYNQDIEDVKEIFENDYTCK